VGWAPPASIRHHDPQRGGPPGPRGGAGRRRHLADSDPAREFAETEAKAQAVFEGPGAREGARLSALLSGVLASWRLSFAVFKLLSTTGEQSIDLQPGRIVVVGRAVTSDVPIYDPTISRRHAEVSLADGGVKVKDVGSSNGTFLNGARITEHSPPKTTSSPLQSRVPGEGGQRPGGPPQVVPSVSAEFTGAKPAGGTIVRQLPVSVSAASRRS